MKKPYSKSTQSLLSYLREQGEHIRDLDKERRTAKTKKDSLHKKMVKKGPKGEDIILPGYHERIDAWNKQYDREWEMRDAQEETHYPMSELGKAAVKEYGMPKGYKKRAKKRAKEKTNRLLRKALEEIRSKAAKRRRR